MPSKSKVCFFFEVNRTSLKDRTRLKRFIEFLFKRERKKLESLNYIFCSDQRVLKINKQFLKHNFFTDIITFELSESSFTNGEIYISLDRVKDNAKTLGISPVTELHRVIFHGALHLCGFKDKTPKDEVIMRKKEDEYLKRYMSFT